MTIGSEITNSEKYVIEKLWDETFHNGFNLFFTKKIFRLVNFTNAMEKKR